MVSVAIHGTLEMLHPGSSIGQARGHLIAEEVQEWGLVIQHPTWELAAWMSYEWLSCVTSLEMILHEAGVLFSKMQCTNQ